MWKKFEDLGKLKIRLREQIQIFTWWCMGKLLIFELTPNCFLAIKIAFYDIMHQIYYSDLVHWGSFEDILPFTIFFSIMKSPTMVKITNWIVGYFSRTRQKVMQTELRTWTISAKLTKYNYAVYKTTLFCLRRQPSKSM